MTGVQRLQRLLSSQRQLHQTAIRQSRKAVCQWENVHLGAVKCCRGLVDFLSEDAAADVHYASDQKDAPHVDHPRKSADWSSCLVPIPSSSATRMRRPHSLGNPQAGQSKVFADIGEGFAPLTWTIADLNATAKSLHSSILNASLVKRSLRQSPLQAPRSIARSSPLHTHSLTASSHSHSTNKHSLSVGGTRGFATESAAEVADVLVEHLDTDGSDHPTDADLDRALGEPSSKASVTDVVKGSTPKVSIEATKLFNRVWNQVVIKMGGIESLNIPKEIVWLNGAPGSGKGANTPFILQTRGFPTKAISISNLLQDDQAAQEIMKSGALLSDSHVLELVLEGILRMGFVDSPDEEGDEIPDEDEIIAGVVVDGFPRTTMQVDFVKLLHDKLADLHYQHMSTGQEHHFPRPIFRIAVLYVEEEESVRRQLHRGRAALAHNQRVKESGLGDLAEVRETDLDERAARRRYQIFREHYDTLLRLKSFFPFHLIDAMGTLAQCREQIAEELQYQSGLELGEDTFRAICHLPLAKNLVKQARQNMVTRLDAYMKHDLETFKKVIDIIEHEVIPIVRKCALAGVALYNTERPLFFQHPEASEMLADVLSERGYYVTWQTRTREIPVKVDLTTGGITCEKRVSLQFRIKFDRPIIRGPTLYPSADEKA